MAVSTADKPSVGKHSAGKSSASIKDLRTASSFAQKRRKMMYDPLRCFMSLPEEIVVFHNNCQQAYQSKLVKHGTQWPVQQSIFSNYSFTDPDIDCMQDRINYERDLNIQYPGTVHTIHTQKTLRDLTVYDEDIPHLAQYVE